MPENTDLSEREIEILRLVATGASNKEIAQKLVISANTVKVHMRNIFAKIGAASRTEAAMYAVKMGFAGQASPQVVQIEEEKPSEGFIPADVEILRTPLPKASRSVGRRVFLALALGGTLLLVWLLSLVMVDQNAQTRQPTALPGQDVTQEPWQEKAALITVRSGMALATYENQIYAIGGKNERGPISTTERYDPGENTWIRLAEKPVPVSDVQAGVIGGKIYVPGGRLFDGKISPALEIYEPLGDIWTRGADLPLALSAYALAAYEGKLYVIGGWDGLRFVNRVFQYDPSQDAWLERSPMPTARGYSGAAVVAGKIYVFGGYDGDATLAVNEVYSPDQEAPGQNPWRIAQVMPSACSAMGSTSIAEVIITIGGLCDDQPGQPALSFEYSYQLDEWQEIGLPLTTPWIDLRLVAITPYVYAIGGELDGKPTGQSLTYRAVYTVMMPVIR